MVKVELTRNPVASIVGEVRKAHDAFEKSIRSSLELAVELGRKLNEAKAKLPHGEFGKLFRDHASPVEGALPFSARWAQKVMVIAENDTISNTKHASYLPSDLETIHQLSLMDGKKLEKAIEKGDVRPDMTRADAKKLVAEMEPERLQRATKEKNEDDMRSEFLDKFKAFYDFASDFVARFPQHKINIKLCIRNLSQLLEKNDE
jgi:hypothetical protein